MGTLMWALGGARRERLKAAVASFGKEKFLQSVPDEKRSKLADEALQTAGASLSDGDLHAGWGSLATARRVEVFTLTREALIPRAKILSAEAKEKLSGWRKEAAAALLPSEFASLSDEELRARVWLIQHLVDGAADNRYFKQAIVSEATLMLMRLAALFTITAVAVLTPTIVFPAVPSDVKSMALIPFR